MVHAAEMAIEAGLPRGVLNIVTSNGPDVDEPIGRPMDINSFDESDFGTPFGGYIQSGFGRRDDGVHAHDPYTQLKTIWIFLVDDADEAVG